MSSLKPGGTEKPPTGIEEMRGNIPGDVPGNGLGGIPEGKSIENNEIMQQAKFVVQGTLFFRKDLYGDLAL